MVNMDFHYMQKGQSTVMMIKVDNTQYKKEMRKKWHFRVQLRLLERFLF